jgi:flavonoid 3',5'-hydroxylase
MGTCDTIIASSPKAARAFLKTLDHNFLNRPTIIGATHLGYNSQDLVFAKYGPKWKLLRKLTTLHMLGGKALQNWGNVRENEVKNMVRSIHEIGIKGEPIEIGDLLSCAITNMVSQVVLSKRIFENKGQESKEFKEMVVEFMTISGVNIGDFVPFIGWMDLEGVVSKMKRLHKKFDVFLTKMIEDHVKCAHERKDKPNFLDILMENGNDHFGERLSLSNIKALLLVPISLSQLYQFIVSFQLYKSYYLLLHKLCLFFLSRFLFYFVKLNKHFMVLTQISFPRICSLQGQIHHLAS